VYSADQKLPTNTISIRISLLLSFAVAFCVTGCFGLTVHSEHFTYREPVQVDEERLKVGGYYWNDRNVGIQVYAVADGDGVQTYWTEWAAQQDSMIQPIVLWENGTAAYFDGYSGGTYRSGRMVDAGTYEAAHELFQRHLGTVTGERAFQHPMWGAFRLRGDSISIQVMMALHNPGGTFSEEYGTALFEGVIESDTSFTITSISIPEVSIRDSLDWKYRFRSLEEKPPPSNWTQTNEELQ